MFCHLITNLMKCSVFEGEFGVIYKGYYKSGIIDAVAVKTLKGKLLDGLHNIVELDS